MDTLIIVEYLAKELQKPLPEIFGLVIMEQISITHEHR